jgi:hypothetical protein
MTAPPIGPRAIAAIATGITVIDIERGPIGRLK